MRSAAQIRSEFIEFFKGKNHTFVPSSPIVPKGDETLLFANAGMNQFKDIFLGLSAPSYPRAVNSQKCLRVSGKHNDLEEVGKDTYHHTFFEMLGNWSFGDYFKAEAIEWAWELFTKVWGIDPNRLWATVFAGDEHDGLPEDTEAKNLWTKVTSIPPERVLSFGKKDNFWEMGETGPCGPCSEIHIDLGPERCDLKNVPGHECKVNKGCARYVELWNLVFIQYNRQPGGKLVPLSSKYVDTGAGLERVVSVMQNTKSNYDTDLFMPIINYTSRLSGCKYTSKLGNQTDNAFRVVADHIRSLVFAITDGATPSNDGRGYVIRRILRRASRFGRELGMHEPFLYKLVPVVVDCLGNAFGEIKERSDYVSTVIKSEEESFGRTLDRGIEIFNSAADKAQQSSGKIISGEDAFQLYDTFGFPLDLTQLMAQERNLKVDSEKFAELMEQQRERARASQKNDSFLASLTDTELPVTEDIHKYHLDSCQCKIAGWIDKDGFKKTGQIQAGMEVGLILDQTCFYAEMGGQVGDCGVIDSNNARFIVEDTLKIANCIIHKGKLAEGSMSAGQLVTAIVSKDRAAIKKNHTATHLLQWALQNVLGKSVAQQGSFVGPDYLRFDFTYPKSLTREELKKVEELIREKIVEDLPVTTAVLPREKAQELGAMALFGEKYGDEVRVVAIGDDVSPASSPCLNERGQDALATAFSKEFCGGTHVDKIGDIGGFKIIKEESVSAGVRRITALAGSALNSYLEKASEIVDTLSVMLKVPSDELVDRVEKLLANNKELAKKLKSASKASGSDSLSQARELLDNCQKIGESSIVVGKLSGVTVEQAREAIDMLKKKAQSAAIVLGFDEDGKVTLISGMTNDLVAKGLSAGDIVKAIALIVDGGGGGRPQMAQAGGKNPEKIDEALKRASEIIAEKLNA
ncbi:MAG: alanine--tRNA ligase [Sedimentisphaerales bacterium]|nr:alanine--tRNA ligase [Sedimentisphaerales bacterium]